MIEERHMKHMHCKPGTLEAGKDSKVVKARVQMNRKLTPPQEPSTARLTEIFMALDPRVLFDVASLAKGAEAVQDPTTPVNPGIKGKASTDSTHTDFSDQDTLRLSGLSLSAPSNRNEIEESNPAAEVILLDSTRDGIEKITKGLKGRKNIDAIHLISHANQAGLRLGTGHLTFDLIHGTFVAELTIISDARSGTGNIFTDGCNDGERAVGRAVVEKFAQLTCADIAASTDLPGSANFGVQWDLELNGVFPYIIDSAGSEEWQGLLTETTYLAYESASLVMGEQANEVHSTKPWGQTFLYDSTRSIYTVDRNGLVLTSTFPSGSS
jgi:Domain of unknown function (DUF4347)